MKYKPYSLSNNPLFFFVSYWTSALLIYVFSPFKSWTIEYDVFFITIFLFFISIYSFSKGINYRPFIINSKLNVKFILQFTAILSSIGTAIVFFDLLRAGFNPGQVLTDSVERGEFNTGIFTTIGSIARSFKLVFISYYMWFLINKKYIPFLVNIQIIIFILFEFLLMFGGGDRTFIYFILATGYFYLSIVKRLTFNDIFASKKLFLSIILTISIAIFYFGYISDKRTGDDYKMDLARDIAGSTLIGGGGINDNVAGLIVLNQGYFVGSFPFISAAISNSDLLYFEPIMPFGGYFLANVRRFFPSYTPDSVNRIRMWWFSVGNYSESTWAGIFGLSFAFFGIIGSFIFLHYFFYFYGRCSKALNSNYFSPQALCLDFVIFSGVSRSFDWIFHDISLVTSVIFLILFSVSE